MAAGFGLSAQDLLRGILGSPHGVKVTNTPATGLELFLSPSAQVVLARFSGLPRLPVLLPNLAAPHSRLVDDEVRRAAWYGPCGAWVGACPPCTARAWRPGQGVLVYPGAAGHVCRRHRRWLLAHTERPASIPLQTLPEVLAAHRRHAALVRAHPRAEQVVSLAAAVVWSWQVQGWNFERVWQDRARRLTAATGCTSAAVVPHALLTYPETIVIARLLGDPRWQQRLRAATTTTGTAAAATMLLKEIGRRVDRPWLADWLAACTRIGSREAARTDPLQRWLLKSADGANGDALWSVHQSAARPTGYSNRARFLTDRRSRFVVEEAKAASLTGGWEPWAAPRAVPDDAMPVTVLADTARLCRLGDVGGVQ
ncbi:hypothetical protein [Streptomyces sp. NPDC051677]|uniref:hypothetical protein n=1 Tax=Streptomyces sp. NPDC051677 TaxID=3365669 RepID=UPI0037D01843